MGNTDIYELLENPEFELVLICDPSGKIEIA